MKRSTPTKTKNRKNTCAPYDQPGDESLGSIRAEVIVGIVGFILSITLHELLHVVLHLHQITGIRFFSNPYTVAELVVNIPASYDLASEEFIAYGISAAVLLVTAWLIGQIHDSSDTRTVRQMLFPAKKSQKARQTKTSAAKK